MTPVIEHIAPWGVLGVFLAAATITDVRRLVIPNLLVGAALLAGLLLHIAGPGELVSHAAIGAGLGGGVLLISLAHERLRGTPGFGMGDVKAAAVLGLLVGWHAAAILITACLAGAIVGVAGIAAGLADRSTRIPFAPMMLVGAVTVFVISVV